MRIVGHCKRQTNNSQLAVAMSSCKSLLLFLEDLESLVLHALAGVKVRARKRPFWCVMDPIETRTIAPLATGTVTINSAGEQRRSGHF